MINNVFPTILIGGLLFFCFGKVSKRAIVLLVGFSSRGSFRQSAGCFIPGEDNLVVLGVPGGVFVIDALESGPVCRYGLPLENLEAMDQFVDLV